jgi:hypothetical protein
MESRRGGRMLRACAMIESILRCWSADGRQDGSFAPWRRVTMLTARIES